MASCIGRVDDGIAALVYEFFPIDRSAPHVLAASNVLELKFATFVSSAVVEELPLPEHVFLPDCDVDAFLVVVLDVCPEGEVVHQGVIVPVEDSVFDVDGLVGRA